LSSLLAGGAAGLLLFAILSYGGVEAWSNAVCVTGAGALGVGAVFLDRPRSRSGHAAAARPAVLAVGWTLAALGILLAFQVAPLDADLVRRLSPGSALLYDNAVPGSAAWRLSVYPEGTLLAAARLVSFILFLFAALRFLDSRRSVLRFALALSVIGFAVALFGILQKTAWNGRIYWIGSPAPAPFGPYVNKNTFAGLMTLAMPVTAGLFLSSSITLPSSRSAQQGRLEGSRVLRIAALGTMAATMFLATLMSLSRGGALSLLLAVVVIGVPVLLGRMRRSREWFTTLLLTLTAVTALWLGAGGGFARLKTLFLLSEDASFSTRLLMWKDMLAMAREFPLFGSGFGTFSQAFLPYRTFGSSSAQELPHGHNEHLQLLVEGGAAGCLVIGAGFAVFLFLAYTALRRRRDAEAVYLAGGSLVGLTAFIFHSLSTANLRIPANALAFAAVAALALGALRSSRPRETS
jgi:O-antigen ligase